MGRLMNHRRLLLLGTLGVAVVLVAGTTLALAGRLSGAGSPSPRSQPGTSVALAGPTPTAPPTTGAAMTSSQEPRLTAAPSAQPSVGPTASASAEPSPGLVPPQKAGPFEMDIYEKGDFTSEKQPIWCAPAALQTMINIMSPGADRTRATQKLLHTISRKLGPAPDKGSEPEGMAKALESLGYGRYRVVVAASRATAFRVAATALRLTGRPVALLVWRGAHNWVMSGFRSTADPALGPDFKVTHLWIEDVWYPRVSSIWGKSRPPDTLVPVGLMPEDYLPWRRPTGRYPSKDGTFVLIVPVAPG